MSFVRQTTGASSQPVLQLQPFPPAQGTTCSLHTKVPALRIFLNTFSKKKLTEQQKKKGHYWKGSCEAPQSIHIQSSVCHPSPEQGAASSWHSLGHVPLAGQARLLLVLVPVQLGGVRGANSPGMVCDLTWGEEPSRGPTPGAILGMSFVEMVCNSRLGQTGCVSQQGWEDMERDMALQAVTG